MLFFWWFFPFLHSTTLQINVYSPKLAFVENANHGLRICILRGQSGVLLLRLLTWLFHRLKLRSLPALALQHAINVSTHNTELASARDVVVLYLSFNVLKSAQWLRGIVAYIFKWAQTLPLYNGIVEYYSFLHNYKPVSYRYDLSLVLHISLLLKNLIFAT